MYLPNCYLSPLPWILGIRLPSRLQGIRSAALGARVGGRGVPIPPMAPSIHLLPALSTGWPAGRRCSPQSPLVRPPWDSKAHPILVPSHPNPAVHPSGTFFVGRHRYILCLSCLLGRWEGWETNWTRQPLEKARYLLCISACAFLRYTSGM